jgi:hypothetical protein
VSGLRLNEHIEDDGPDPREPSTQLKANSFAPTKCLASSGFMQWFAGDLEWGDHTYRVVTCLACRQVHLVNANGKVLGTDEEWAGSPLLLLLPHSLASTSALWIWVLRTRIECDGDRLSVAPKRPRSLGSLGCDHTVPSACLVARHELPHRRDQDLLRRCQHSPGISRAVLLAYISYSGKVLFRSCSSIRIRSN